MHFYDNGCLERHGLSWSLKSDKGTRRLAWTEFLSAQHKPISKTSTSTKTKIRSYLACAGNESSEEWMKNNGSSPSGYPPPYPVTLIDLNSPSCVIERSTKSRLSFFPYIIFCDLHLLAQNESAGVASCGDEWPDCTICSLIEHNRRKGLHN